MPTHPLWRAYERPSDEQIARARVTSSTPTPTPRLVEVVAPDPTWPEAFARLGTRLLEALGPRVLALEHVGSTAVPGLWAKPVIDVDLTVADSADEAAWLPGLAEAGLDLRVREPEWEEHRCLRSEDPAGNVHVWSPGAQEPRRHVAFRDWLRTHGADREAYGRVKVEVAARGFTDAMQYNNAKGAFVYDLYERIFAADADQPHDHRPRG